MSVMLSSRLVVLICMGCIVLVVLAVIGKYGLGDDWKGGRKKKGYDVVIV